MYVNGNQNPAVTSYGYDIEPFVAGQATDSSLNQVDTVSTLVQHIPYGLVLCYTATPGIVELPSASNRNFAGVARHQHLDPVISGDGYIDPMITGYPPKFPIPLFRIGRIAVPLDSDILTIATNMPVYVRKNVSGTKIPGQVRTNSTDADLWEKARFTGRLIPGKLAEISIVLN